jgi:hypothetical protein
MKPHPETVNRVQEVLTGLVGDPSIASMATTILEGEGLLTPTPANQHPEWIGVIPGVDVGVDETRFGSKAEKIVRIDFRNKEGGVHLGLRPFALEQLLEKLTEARDEIKRHHANEWGMK